MYFYFGTSISESLSRYFTERANADGHKVVHASMGEFTDTEPFAELFDDPSDQLCVVFQSITKADQYNASSHFMQMLLCANNLERNGARAIWGVNPLAGLMRQDASKPERMESVGSELCGELMRTSGFNGMSTVEAHSDKAIENYEVGLGAGNVLNINPNDLFERAVKRLGLQLTTMANPDGGADARSKDLAEKLGLSRFGIEKDRKREGPEIVGHSGDVGDQTALLDDMASSLTTAKNAVEFVYDEGSKKNVLLISHAIMVGPAWDNLAKLIREEKLDHVIFLPTIAREAEFSSFAKQYGPNIADKITFLNDDYNEMIYNHVTQKVANHPSMRLAT